MRQQRPTAAHRGGSAPGSRPMRMRLHRRPSAQRARGFTLVEVAFSVLLLSIVGAGVLIALAQGQGAALKVRAAGALDAALDARAQVVISALGTAANPDLATPTAVNSVLTLLNNAVCSSAADPGCVTIGFQTFKVSGAYNSGTYTLTLTAAPAAGSVCPLDAKDQSQGGCRSRSYRLPGFRTVGTAGVSVSLPTAAAAALAAGSNRIYLVTGDDVPVPVAGAAQTYAVLNGSTGATVSITVPRSAPAQPLATGTLTSTVPCTDARPCHLALAAKTAPSRYYPISAAGPVAFSALSSSDSLVRLSLPASASKYLGINLATPARTASASRASTGLLGANWQVCLWFTWADPANARSAAPGCLNDPTPTVNESSDASSFKVPVPTAAPIDVPVTVSVAAPAGTACQANASVAEAGTFRYRQSTAAWATAGLCPSATWDPTFSAQPVVLAVGSTTTVVVLPVDDPVVTSSLPACAATWTCSDGR